MMGSTSSSMIQLAGRQCIRPMATTISGMANTHATITLSLSCL